MVVKKEEENASTCNIHCSCSDMKVISPGQVVAEQQSAGGNPMSVYLSAGTAMTVSISAVANAVGLKPDGQLSAKLYLQEVSRPPAQHLVSAQHTGSGDLSVHLSAVVALRATVSYLINFDDDGHDNRAGTNYLTVTVVSAP